MILYKLENESVSYEKQQVLDNISLCIEEGEKVALLGKSGSGKTTLLKTLHDLSFEKSAYLPQDLGLIENLSVFHNIYTSQLENKSSLYNLINLIRPFKKEVESIKKILKELDLDEKLFKKSLNLSGGQQQRVAISKAIFSQKNILLADEPISALDEYFCLKVLNLFDKYFETFVCAMHNVDLALSHFDRVIGIKNGKIILDKKTADISKEDTLRLYHVVE